MADFSHILATRPDFDDEDREWLQVIADLSFADLLLLVQDGDGKYVVAEQCRPSTVMTLRAEDVVGNVMPDDMVGELDAAMLSSVVFRSTVLRTVGKATVCNVYAPERPSAWWCARPTWPHVNRTAAMSRKASTPASICTR